MSKDRIERVNELLFRELGEIFTSVVSPDVPFLVTVTGAKVSVDLRDAVVFVSVYGTDAQKRQALTFLQKKRALIQSRLSRKVILKYTPVLHFKLDETAERADRVETILRELNLDGEVEPPAPKEEE